MKESNVKRRIIAMVLATISATSVATATLPAVSAKTSTVSSNYELNIDGRAIYNKAQEQLIKVMGKAFKDFPGGSYFLEIYKYCLSLSAKTIDQYFEEEKQPEGPTIADIQEQLGELKKQIVEISSDIKLNKNKSFDDAIDEISWLCDDHYPKLEKLVDAEMNLIEAKKNGDKDLIIEKEAELNIAIEDVKDIPYKTLKEKLQKAMKYITDNSISSPNPFINFYEAKKSAYTYGKDAIAETNKQYDEKVWKIFYVGVSIYDTAMQLNIDELYNNPDTHAQGEKLANELSVFLSGNGSDSDTSSVAYATNYYKTNTLEKKNESINSFYYDTDKAVEFNDFATGKVNDKGFFATGDKKNASIVKYIDNYSQRNKKKQDNNATWKEYFTAINTLINNEYMSGDNHSITLRHFLEEKFNFTVPESAEYLVCGQNDYKWSVYGGECTYDGKIPLIKLDESRATIKNVTYASGITGIQTKADLKNIDNICYLMTSADADEAVVAEVIVGNETIEFTNISDAWEFANENSGCTLKLQSDWVAQKKGDDNFTVFGSGEYFQRDDGEKIHYGALYVRNSMTVDLNGYTINRNQDIAVEDGSVFILNHSPLSFKLIDSSEKQGKVTGGNTKGKGGAIVDLNKNIIHTSFITVEDVCLSGNHADEEGGAIFFSACSNSDGLIIKNCTIENNSSNANGGGVFAAVGVLYAADVILDGTVKVSGNTVNGKANNFTLDENLVTKSVLKFKSTFSDNSRIGVNTVSTSKSIDFTEGNANIKNYKSVFTADNTNSMINIYKSVISSKYYGEIKEK